MVIGAAPWYDLGCEGGDFEGGVDYIVANGGIDTEEDYPYLAHDDKCMWAATTTCCTWTVELHAVQAFAVHIITDVSHGKHVLLSYMQAKLISSPTAGYGLACLRCASLKCALDALCCQKRRV